MLPARLDVHALEVRDGGGAGGVGADVVPGDQVAGLAAARPDQDAEGGVARDDVPGSGRRTAHGVAARRVPEVDAVAARCRGPPCRSRWCQSRCRPLGCRACREPRRRRRRCRKSRSQCARGAADRVAKRPADLDAVARVVKELGTGLVSADLVALYQVARCTAPRDDEAGAVVARDQIGQDRVVRAPAIPTPKPFPTALEPK